MPFYESNTTAPEEFSIVVTDPNPFDKLSVRWVSDYPPYSTLKSKLLQSEEATPDGRITFRVKDCTEFQSGTPSPHRLVVVVADRKFEEPADASNPEYPFNSVKDKGFWIMAGWVVTCP